MNIKCSQKGSIVIAFVVFLTGLLLVMGSVIDCGYIYVKKLQLQNSLDAAVLAGAYELPNTQQAILMVKKYMSANGFKSSKVNWDFSQDNKRIRISCTQSIDTFFFAALGIKKIRITAEAAARLRNTISGKETSLVNI